MTDTLQTIKNNESLFALQNATLDIDLDSPDLSELRLEMRNHTKIFGGSFVVKSMEASIKANNLVLAVPCSERGNCPDTRKILTFTIVQKTIKYLFFVIIGLLVVGPLRKKI